MRHLLVRNGFQRTYCNRSAYDVPTTRFRLLNRCKTCHTVQEIESMLGIDLAEYQRTLLLNVMAESL